jgi:hypothetical protein
MERIESGLDAFMAWQERLKRFESSGMPIDKFCQQEEVCRTQLVEWLRVLRGTPERSEEEGATFASVSVKSQSIEILLPGGGMIRLSAGIQRLLLLDVIRHVSAVLQESR